MSEAIIVALITGGLSLAGVVITCLAAARKTEKAAAEGSYGFGGVHHLHCPRGSCHVYLQ